MIYADNAATTRMSEGALRVMTTLAAECWGNPSSLYVHGQKAKEVLEEARAEVAAIIGANPREIIFTSGGSEADNQAIRTAAELGRKAGKKHIISTAFEHHAVLHTLAALEKEGFEVTLLDVHENGIVKASEVEAAIREDTCLVTVMAANNEIGTIQPFREIGAVCRKKNVLFHVDAVQAVAGIAAMAEALKEANAGMKKNAEHLVKMRDRLISGLQEIPHSALNGDAAQRLPGNVNFCFEGIEGESLLLLLDDKGICASSGSACTSGSLDPSHVLLAIGRVHDVAHGSLRLSIGEEITEEEVDYIIQAVKDTVEYLRGFSPIWRDLVSGKKEFIL